MINFLKDILNYVKKCKNVIIISSIVVIVGLIFGFLFNIDNKFLDFYYEYLCSYLNYVLGANVSILSILIKRIINAALLLVLVGILCLNKYTIYLNFLIILYRAFTLGIAGKLLLIESVITGSVIFLFLILIQGLFTCFSITIYFCIMKERLCSLRSPLKYSINTYFICLIISLIGAVLEFLIILTLFIPLKIFI